VRSSCTAAILAGGQARRLGGVDKSALVIGNARIIDRQLAVLQQVADRVFIVGGDAERCRSLDITVQGRGPTPAWVVPDLVPGAGALGGIYTAVTASPDEQTLVIACDLPCLTALFLRHLVAAGRESDLAIPRTDDGYQPLCASYSRACLEPIRRRIETGSLKAADLVHDVRVREIGPDEIARFDPAGTLFLNINTPDDYARARALLEQPDRS
jgi:molybdopterin-guanine dinucleotide biosynthesis protein A